MGVKLIKVFNTVPFYIGNTTLEVEVNGFISLNTVVDGFSDAEGDSYKFGLATTPAPPRWLIVDRETGIVSATMISGYQGNYTINITATDECGGNPVCGKTGWQLFDIVVPNRKPYFQYALPVPPIVQRGVETRFHYVVPSDTVLDFDGDKITWTTMLADGKPLPLGLSFNSVTRVLSGIPVAGIYNLTMMASDSYGGVVNQTITLHVNTPPVALTTPWSVDTLLVGQNFTAELPKEFMVDADGDLLAYSLVDSNAKYFPPSWLSLTNRTLTGVPIANDHQAITIQVKGEDGFGGEAYRLVTISIPNSVPTVSRELGVITAFAGDLKTYIVPRNAVKDTDGDVLAHSSFRRGESGGLPLPSWAVHLSSINSFNLVPKSGDQGNYTFVLVATDTQDASIQTELNVIVPNRVPVLSTSYADTNLGPLEELGYEIDGRFTDADDDSLHYRFAMPSWVHYDAETKTLSGMPPQTIEDYPITITADDGHGGQNRARFIIHVDPTALELNTAQQLQLIGYGGLAVAVMFLASCFVVRRQKRVTTAE